MILCREGDDGNQEQLHPIQYRVNLINCPTCAPWASPCLSRVTLYYRRVYTIFLPLTLKSYTP